MDVAYLQLLGEPEPLPGESVFDTLLRENGRVVVTALIRSFGLELLANEAALLSGNEGLRFDANGGDVDTIRNVREGVGYKREENARSYESRGAYDPVKHHTHPSYVQYRRELRREAMENSNGVIEDAYTGRDIAFTTAKGHPWSRVDIDHVLSAKWIHDDPGRVLAGLDGVELSASPSNLRPTNKSLNASMGDKEIPDYLDSHREIQGDQADRMMRAHEEALGEYESSLAVAYYTSPAFLSDMRRAAVKRSVQMASRQVCGLMLAEIWFAVRERMLEAEPGFDPGALMRSVAEGAREGLTRAARRYRELLAATASGVVSGALASVTNTICNTFMTTSEDMGKAIRESYAALVEAARILIVNPDCLLPGERLRSAAKAIAMGASVVLGTCTSARVARTVGGLPPALGEAITTFCDMLVAGSVSCTLLVYLDRSRWANQLVATLDDMPSVERGVMRMRLQSERLVDYAARLEGFDRDRLETAMRMVDETQRAIDRLGSDVEFNAALRALAGTPLVSVPWGGSFDEFMRDDSSFLRFA